MKVERFVATLWAEFTLGQPCEVTLRDWIDRSLTVDKLMANAPCADFLKVGDVGIDGVDVTRAPSGASRAVPEDVFEWVRRGGVTCAPTRCDHGVRARFTYTGRVPEGRGAGDTFRFALVVSGEGSIP